MDLQLQDVLDNLVCRTHLFSFLHVNDLLRIRRVCKSFQNVADDFIQTQKVETRRVLLIYLDSDDENPFENVEQFHDASSLSHLRTRTRVHFWFPNNANGDHKDDDDDNDDDNDDQVNHGLHEVPLQQLLGTCVTNITHLTINNLKVPVFSAAILEFFESFPNISSLKLLEPTTGNDRHDEESAVSKGFKIPSTFKRLKNLTIITNETNFWQLKTRSFVIRLLDTCISSLDQLSMHFGEFWGESDIPADEQVTYFIRQILFSSPKLKLMSVDGPFIDLLTDPDNTTPGIGILDARLNIMNAKVASIYMPIKMPFPVDFPNLEEIDFEYLDFSPIPKHGFLRRDWPKLKKMQIKFNGGKGSPKPGRIWDFLFVGIRRENLANLDIGLMNVKKCQLFAAADIVASCSNLKILRIREDISKLANITNLWRGLTKLEELCFYQCTNLKLEDLIGEDTENPAFWSLKDLKELQFFDVWSTKLTDDLFVKVLCQMPLKSLHLSDHYTKNSNLQITLDGIKGLLSGIFASTVERFSIRTLNIKGVTWKEKVAFEKLFRSSQMF